MSKFQEFFWERSIPVVSQLASSTMKTRKLTSQIVTTMDCWPHPQDWLRGLPDCVSNSRCSLF